MSSRKSIFQIHREVFLKYESISVNMGIKTIKNQSFIYRLPNVSLILDDF